MDERIRAGFVGLGDMGGPIAGRIIDAGFPTTLWARRPEALDPYAGKSFNRAKTLQDLGGASAVVGVCVFGDADVREVVLGDAAIVSGMAPGGIILVHSTISEEMMTDLDLAARACGVSVLDAPVSGGSAGAKAGTLAVMVGGDADAFYRAMPVMDSFGAKVLRMGPLGCGQRAKVLNNVLTFCNLSTGYLALEAASRLGLDQESTAQILRSGGARSFALDQLVERIIPDADWARHSSGMVEKDTRIFQKICATQGVERTLLDELAEHAITFVRELGDRPPR